MVKDHRTNKDIGNAQSVLDGNINPFINAYLNWVNTGKKQIKNIMHIQKHDKEVFYVRLH